MPSFDISSKVDGQLLDNAVNVAKREILNRWDFKASKSEIELNKKDLKKELFLTTPLYIILICFLFL